MRQSECALTSNHLCYGFILRARWALYTKMNQSKWKSIKPENQIYTTKKKTLSAGRCGQNQNKFVVLLLQPHRSVCVDNMYVRVPKKNETKSSQTRCHGSSESCFFFFSVISYIHRDSTHAQSYSKSRCDAEYGTATDAQKHTDEWIILNMFIHI